MYKELWWRAIINILFLELGLISSAIAASTILPISTTREPLGPSSRRGALVISEIMLQPPDDWAGNSSAEFIELYNSGLITEDLTGHHFRGGVTYTFPPGTSLAPGAFLVVAKNPAAAQAYYGVPCIGPFAKHLSNTGESLRLHNELGGILLEVEYGNRRPWPAAVFGTGHSLVLQHPSYGEADVRAWAASDRIGGSPGVDETVGTDAMNAVVINEFLAHTDLPQVDYIELFNTGASAVDLSGAFLSDEAGINKYSIPSGTILPAGGFLSFDQTQLGFALSSAGESVFLVNAANTRVIDAVSFEGQANGVSEGRHPDGASGFQPLTATTPGAANAQPALSPVVINEVMFHPISGASKDEYVELYNRTDQNIDLSGWRIRGGVSFDFPNGTSIPADGYVVVAKDAGHLISNYAQLNASNTLGGFSGSLDNRGDAILLSKPEDQLTTNAAGAPVEHLFFIPVDEVTYQDGGRWGKWSDGGGSSLELIDPDADNRRAANWADSDESNKAPWTTIDVTEILQNGQFRVDEGTSNGRAEQCNRLEFFTQGMGEALVDEVQFLQGGQNFVANGDFSSGASGWTFGGISSGSTLAAGQGPDMSTALRIACASRGDTAVNKVSKSLTMTPTINGSSTGTLRAKVRWLKGAKQFYIRLRGNWMEVNQDLVVPADCGTPGLANSRRVSNAGPAIHGVVHCPILPSSGERVVVTARAVDPEGVASMTLHYRIDPSLTGTTATMNDAGTGGDRVAQDGIYTATIPGMTFGTMAAFYISASDGDASSRFPDQAPNEGLVRWGEPQFAGQVGTYRLWMTAGNLAKWNNRHTSDNTGLDATFVYGNSRVIYNASTQYSGSPFHSASYNGPLGAFACDYEINFPKDNRFLGSTAFVLSAEEADGGFWFDPSAQVDLTGTWIGRKLGQQYNYRRHVHMMFNGIRRGTIYQDGQQPNSEMLKQYFPDDSRSELRKIEDWFEYSDDLLERGNIFGRIARVNKSSGGIDPKWFRWNWRPRATDDYANWFNFTNLVAAVNDAAAVNREQRIRTWMDVRNFLRPIATYRIAGCWDTYAYERGKNAYAFKPDDQGWRLLLWDIETALGNSSRPSNDSIYGSEDPILFDMITSIPSLHREYLMAFQEAVDGPLAPGVAASILNERYANLQASGVAVGSPQSIINYINERRIYLQGILPRSTFGVEGSTTRTNASNNFTLNGTASLRSTDIQINGITQPVQWTGTTTWRLQVPLESGVNSLVVSGIDRHGNPVPGSRETLTVSVTGPDTAPEGVVVINEIHPSPADRDLQFLELANTSSESRFDLSGWRIDGIDYSFPPGSSIAPAETLVLVRNRYRFASQHKDVPIFDTYGGSLKPAGETLTLYRPGPDGTGQEVVVDRVLYEGSAPWPDTSNGGSLQLIDASRDNARVGNWAQSQAAGSNASVNVVAFTDTWRYRDDGMDLGTTWRSSTYDDSAWPSGESFFYQETSSPNAANNTPLVNGHTTSYFRKTFTYGDLLAGARLYALTMVNDGVVLYLNGQEIFRLGMPLGEITSDTPASRFVSDAEIEGVFTLPAAALVNGENTLAAEVHQHSPANRDAVFGLLLNVHPRITAESSPGRANYTEAALPPFPELWLNEIHAENLSGPVDNAGDRDPWIELHNAGASSVVLDDLFLTNDGADPGKWRFPAGTTVPAGGYLVVWCDGKVHESIAGVPHTSFTLTPGSGRVILSRLVDGQPQVIDYLRYEDLEPDTSYGAVPDAQPFERRDLFFTTPGARNNAAGSKPIFITEWMADNDGTIRDPTDGQFDDWFELYNAGPDPVDLGGYYLTDDLGDQTQFRVPGTGTYVIPPGGYLLVWADDEPQQNVNDSPDLHVNFKLSKSGDAIALFSPAGRVIDSVAFGVQTEDVSAGRDPSALWHVLTLDSPSPGAENTVGADSPRIQSVTMSGDDIILTWPSVSGQQYQLYYKSKLPDTTWSPLGSQRLGTGGLLDSNHATDNGPTGFYKIEPTD